MTMGAPMNTQTSGGSLKISQLEDLSRMQRRFVSDVSHELRTPLTTVRMAADVIHEARVPPGSYNVALSRLGAVTPSLGRGTRGRVGGVGVDVTDDGHLAQQVGGGGGGEDQRVIDLEAEVARLKSEVAESENPSYAGLGGRAAGMLRLAEEEASEIRAVAEADALEIREQATRDAKAIRAEAAREALQRALTHLVKATGGPGLSLPIV